MMRLRHLMIAASIVAAGAVTISGPVSAAPSRIGTESFSLTGVINATGTDIVVSDTEDLFDFGAAGTVTVFHSPLHSTDHFSEKKCTFSFMEKGTYVFGN